MSAVDRNLPLGASFNSALERSVEESQRSATRCSGSVHASAGEVVLDHKPGISLKSLP